jgi:hypothetical protein
MRFCVAPPVNSGQLSCTPTLPLVVVPTLRLSSGRLPRELLAPTLAVASTVGSSAARALSVSSEATSSPTRARRIVGCA